MTKITSAVDDQPLWSFHNDIIGDVIINIFIDLRITKKGIMFV